MTPMWCHSSGTRTKTVGDISVLLTEVGVGDLELFASLCNIFCVAVLISMWVWVFIGGGYIACD